MCKLQARKTAASNKQQIPPELPLSGALGAKDLQGTSASLVSTSDGTNYTLSTINRDRI